MTQQASIYASLGGEDGVRELVNRFYDNMDSDPELAALRAMHAKSLRASREKLRMFLSGWLGGPDLYQQRYGHPMLRRRHLPFRIGSAERDQWMRCMRVALTQMALPASLHRQLEHAFQTTADHMRNQPEGGGDEGIQVWVPQTRTMAEGSGT